MDSRSPALRQMQSIERVFARIVAGQNEAVRSLRMMGNQLQRIYDSPGDRHVERIIKEILAGMPGRDPALRLECAVYMKEVIDRG